MDALISGSLLHKQRKFILIACMLATFMAAVEVTIVATAMPKIIADLSGFPLLGWVFSIYLLVQSVTIPIYGRLADLHGRKSVFCYGTCIFLIGSILCGFSTSMISLILFRGLQGLGAGAITTLSSTIIADIYNQQDRALVQGYLSSVWAVSAIVGPLMGGGIVEHFHWSGVFWVNIPLGIIAIALLIRFLPDRASERDTSPLDIFGICCLTIAISSLLIALLQGNSLEVWVLVLLVVLAITSSALLVRDQIRNNSPLFPITLWQNQIIVASNIGGLIIGAAMMGIAAFLPTYIQAVMGGSTLESGWTLAVMSLGWPLSGTLSGRLLIYTSYRLMALSGALLLFIGNLMLLQLNIHSSILYAGLSAFVIGSGMGISNTTFLVSVQNEASYDIRGIATASIIFVRMLGSAIGTAILGATLNVNLQSRVPQEIDPVKTLIEYNGPHTTKIDYLTQQVALSMHSVYWISALVALCAFGAAWLIPLGMKPIVDNNDGTIDR